MMVNFFLVKVLQGISYVDKMLHLQKQTAFPTLQETDVHVTQDLKLPPTESLDLVSRTELVRAWVSVFVMRH